MMKAWLSAGLLILGCGAARGRRVAAATRYPLTLTPHVSRETKPATAPAPA